MSSKSKKTTPVTSSPKLELTKKLENAYGTIVGEFSDQLSEKEALETTLEVMEKIVQGWEMRMQELEEETGN